MKRITINGYTKDEANELLLQFLNRYYTLGLQNDDWEASIDGTKLKKVVKDPLEMEFPPEETPVEKEIELLPCNCGESSLVIDRARAGFAIYCSSCDYYCEYQESEEKARISWNKQQIQKGK